MSETGHKKELSDATDNMAAALASGDPDAVRAAMGDHATALNSQATAMAASIAAPVYNKLEGIAGQMKQLAEIVTNARQADLTWRTEERIQRDKQNDRLYSELDKLIAASEEAARGLGKLEQDTANLKEGQARNRDAMEALNERLIADEQRYTERLDRKRQELDTLNDWKQRMEVWQAEIDAWRAQTRGDDGNR